MHLAKLLLSGCLDGYMMHAIAVTAQQLDYKYTVHSLHQYAYDYSALISTSFT